MGIIRNVKFAFCHFIRCAGHFFFLEQIYRVEGCRFIIIFVRKYVEQIRGSSTGFHPVGSERILSKIAAGQSHRNIQRICHLRHSALHSIQNGVVTTAWAPLYELVALEICRGVFIFCHSLKSYKSELNFSLSSTTVKGWPSVLLYCSNV